MSPNEFQLRDVLQDGEGDVPDADLVIARAMRLRHERRRRITSIASAAAVIAVVGVGGTLLARNGATESGGASGSGGYADLPGATALTHGGKAGVPAALTPRSNLTAQADASASKADAIACPAQVPREMLPGGGGTNQFGADGPLFAAPVAVMKICEYGPSSLVDAITLDARGASGVVTDLQSGSLTASRHCPTEAPAEGNLAVYAFTQSGDQLRTVTVQLGCPYQATNGTAVRFLSPTTAHDLLPLVRPSPNQGSPPK